MDGKVSAELGSVVFGGIEFPTITMPIDGYCDGQPVTIATESLNAELWDESGDFVNDEAEKVDMGIFYYVPDRVMGMDADAIAEFVKKNIC